MASSSKRVDSTTFLTRLEGCFAQTASSSKVPDEKASGSVWLTHKRYTHVEPSDGQDEEEAMNVGSSSQDFDVLIRCTNGDDISFSCRIPSSALPTFHARYGSLLKSSLAPHMRKRDKKKEKLKLEAGIARRREAYVDVDRAGKRWAKVVVKKPEVKEAEGIVVDGEENAAAGGKAKSKKVGHRQWKRRLLAQRKKEAERERIEEREATRQAAGAGAA